jgi:hypothetical protein
MISDFKFQNANVPRETTLLNPAIIELFRFSF